MNSTQISSFHGQNQIPVTLAVQIDTQIGQFSTVATGEKENLKMLPCGSVAIKPKMFPIGLRSACVISCRFPLPLAVPLFFFSRKNLPEEIFGPLSAH